MRFADKNHGSRTRLVMRIVHSRRLLALASPSRKFALTRATLSRSQADPVLFLITKRVREPRIRSNNKLVKYFYEMWPHVFMQITAISVLGQKLSQRRMLK